MSKRLLLRALLPASFAAPWLPLPWALAVLIVLSLLWLWLQRPPRRELWIAGVTLAGLAGILAFVGRAGLGLAESPADHRQRIAAGYGELWAGLEREAGVAAQALHPFPTDDRPAELAAFTRLEAQAAAWRAARGRRALLLLDADGFAKAWAGDGLLHELRADEVPREGRIFRASWSAVTLFSVRPLDSSPHPWRVVSGVSFPTSIWPFAGPRPASWSLAESPGAERAEIWKIPLAASPTLVVEPRPAGQEADGRGARRLLWATLASGMLLLAGMRALGLAFPGDNPNRPRRPHEEHAWVAAVAAAGVLAAGLAADLAAPFLAALIAGLAGLLLALWCLRAPPAARPGWPLPLVIGGVGAVLLFLAARAFERSRGLLDLGGGLIVPAPELALRLASAAALLGLLAWTGRQGEGRGRRLAATLAVAAWLAALVTAERTSWAGLLLVAGGGAAALAGAGWRREPESRWAGLLLLAALGSTATWEVAYREELARRAGHAILDRLLPPEGGAMRQLQGEIDRGFRGLDLARLVPRTLEGLDRRDLAYTLWRRSPLASRWALSALVVEPLEAGEASSFSFGIPFLAGNRQPDLARGGRWEGLALPAWDQVGIYSEAPLLWRGRPWGRALYWLFPRPGFDPGSRQPLDSVELGLLRGGPAADPIEDLAPALYGVYTPEGRAAVSPWEDRTPLADSLKQVSVEALVRTPTGRARAFVRQLPNQLGWAVVYLPRVAPLAALERAANAIVGLALALAALVPLALLLALPRTAFRNLLRRTVRSYSRRLLLVYTVLLLVPLLLLNFVLVRAVERRLEAQQRAAGEAALAAVQKLVGDYLNDQPVGFALDPARLEERLASASDLVEHKVNLYWRGNLIDPSSKEELFTAGLLPRRIPGEIYRDLALLGGELVSRVNHAGEAAYLELYAPLRIGEDRLFLSVPLLAQQEETARQLSQLRRQGLVITILLFGLAAAVGSRLARNFTRPITELVLGTRRIAAGAPSLGFAPNDELAALVEAIDDMAAKIAYGRERLVQEKHVVERMVDNITSGVVSLDSDRRVLMHNRVAAELLGAAVGERLEAAVGGDPRLAPVAAFLAGCGAERRRETVKLAAPAGGEREWTLVWVPLPSVGEPDALLVVEDATEELRGQRLLAWAEMARIIAHEIKNPLTPIRLSAEHMREVFRHDPEGFPPVFERCTQNVLNQVEELRSIASDFSTYSALLRIDPQPGDLGLAMAELTEGYRAAPPAGVTVGFESDGPMPARFDAKLLSRAVRNLIENALRASAGGGEVTVRVDAAGGKGRIAVLDRGPGVRPETLPRIFDPYFSTHDTGTGLGLPIARRIAEEHGGAIAAHNRPGGGLEVVITLPLAIPVGEGVSETSGP